MIEGALMENVGVTRLFVKNVNLIVAFSWRMLVFKSIFVCIFIGIIGP